MAEEIKNEAGTGFGFDYRTVIPVIALVITLATDIVIPNHQDAKYRELTNFRSVIAAVLVISIIIAIISLFRSSVRKRYSGKAWFMAGFILFVNVLNVATVKLLLLPQIYFPSLNRVLNVYMQEYKFLLKCLGGSFKLLVEGLLIGTVIGIITGILVGWSKNWNYWVYPIIRILGPIPSSTWVPLALVLFPTPRWAAVYIIAFGVWFQITILTSSGIQSVKKSYFEVSSTLGASNLQNLFRIAIPDALPSMFLGFFNATCSSFVALMAAEMLGVKAGIGWYINWQKEMLSYPNVYAGLILIAVFCYLFITIQFKLRDKLLNWQKGVIKW
jgi:NitT/TauT family transport system permease protein